MNANQLPNTMVFKLQFEETEQALNRQCQSLKGDADHYATLSLYYRPRK